MKNDCVSGLPQEESYIINTIANYTTKTKAQCSLCPIWMAKKPYWCGKHIETEETNKLKAWKQGEMAQRSEEETSAGVCSARRRLPSKRKAMDWGSTDWRSQYACISFFSVAVLLILKNTSPPSCKSATLCMSLTLIHSLHNTIFFWDVPLDVRLFHLMDLCRTYEK